MEFNPKQRAGAFLTEFRNFALKGNVIDLAVGVIIGVAFGAVVKSMVDNVFMPLISYITPGMDFTEWTIGKVKIGLLLGDILNFIIVALCLFLFVVKFIGWIMKMKRKEAEAAAAVPPAPTREEVLLTEIRDLLRAK